MKVERTKIAKEVVVVEEQDGLAIELTKKEAAALFAALGRISGSSEKDNLREDCCSELWNKINESFDFFDTYRSPNFSPEVQAYVDTIKTGMVIETP